MSEESSPAKQPRWDFDEDSNGNTLLHRAVIAEDEDLTRELIEHHPVLVHLKNDAGNTPLDISIHSKLKIPIIKLLLDGGADVQATNDLHQTFLHFAAIRGSEILADLVIARGINVNARSENGYTALHEACHYSNINIAKLILKHGGDVHIRSKYKETALHRVKSSANVKELIELLLEFGADVNAKTMFGKTPLQQAIFFNDLTGFETLIQNGADVDAPDNEGNSPLLCAIHSYSDILYRRLLKAGCNVNHKNNEGKGPLHIAVNQNRVGIVDDLLKAGAYINDKQNGREGGTALHIAAGTGNYKMAQFLLKRGADIEAKDINGLTPLHVCVRDKYLGVLKLLINAGCDINARTNSNETVLHFATHLKQPKMAELLLRRGCDINARNDKGETAFYKTAVEGEINFMKILVKYGADVRIRCNTLLSPLQVAMSQKRKKAFEYLLLPCCKPDLQECLLLLSLAATSKLAWFVDTLLRYKPVARAVNNEAKKKVLKALVENDPRVLHRATRDGLFEIVKLFVNNGFDINVRNKIGWTLLETAVCSGSEEIIKYLLDSGSNINCINKTHLVPLHHAVYKQHVAAVETLLRYGADTAAKTPTGNTPLHFAALRCQKQETIFHALFIYGSDIHSKNVKEKTPLETADGVFGMKVFIKYEAILNFAGRYNEENTRLIRSNSFLSKYYEKCCEELQCLKQKVRSVRLSMWDVIWKSVDHVAYYTKNAELTKFIVSKEYKKKCIIYNELITKKIEEATLRRREIDIFLKALKKLKFLVRLPDVIIRIVISYLTLADLRKVTRGYSKTASKK